MKITTFGLFVLLCLNSCGFIFGVTDADTIKNDQAADLYRQAYNESKKGSSGFEKAIELLNQADQIEPKNAIILHERGLVKINSKIDIQGGFIDLQKSIDYSKDEKGKQIRYNNRGIAYMEIGEMEKACDDWHKSGRYGKWYIEKYCKK